MKPVFLAELIAHLQRMLAEFGDVPVYLTNEDALEHADGADVLCMDSRFEYVLLAGEPEVDHEYIASCPACGSNIDHCQGHGETGDPAGFAILQAHDNDDHSDCDEDACDALNTD